MRNCLLAFVVIVFVLLVGPFFAVLNLSQTVLSKDFIKIELNKVDLYNRIVKIDPAELVKMFLGGQEASAEEIAGFKSIISSFSPDLIKNTVEPNLDRIYKSIFENGPNLVEIDLSVARNMLLSKAPDQETKQMFSQMQDKYSWQLSKEFVKLKNYINKPVKYLLPFGIVILLLVALGILLPPSARAKMRSASFLCLMTALTLGSFYLLGQMMTIPLATIPVPQSIKPIIDDLLSIFRSDFVNLFFYEAIAAFVLSIILFALGFLFKRPPEEKSPQTSNIAKATA